MPMQARPRRFVFEYTQAAVIAFIFALFVRTFLIQAFQIPSPSMEDSLLVGDHILVNKFALAPQSLPFERLLLPLAEVRRGDVVVFRYPHDPRQDYVKRVIGLPGETIKIVDRVVYVRKPGAEGYMPLLEPYSNHKDPGGVPPGLDNFEALSIPAGEYFVMGDNRDNSLDSREWGFVPRENIVGRCLLVYWSFDGIDPGGVQAATRSRPGPVGRILSGAGAFFRGTRWDRSFLLIR
ncbi:MAG TPA: signal peptidase I [Candidatus Polarisedimenticolia bacterium]|nr:signal peptidase I [Candidatus Polarisedimenticolia bacterium]